MEKQDISISLSFAKWSVNYYDSFDYTEKLFKKYNTPEQGYHEWICDNEDKAFEKFISFNVR